jgi:hypothetical protein
MDYTLSRGAHATAQDGRCAMEWVSYLAGEAHSDHPACVCPVLREISVKFNDAMPDAQRQRLRPYLARMIGTADDRRSSRRAYRLVDWVSREIVPRALASAGRADLAGTLSALAPVRDFATAQLVAGRLRVIAGMAGLDVDVARLTAVAGTAARGRVPSQAAETVVLAAQLMPELGDAIWDSALAVLDELLPGEVIEVPVAVDWPAVCALA